MGNVEQEAERMSQLVGGEVSAGRASARERAVVHQRAGPGVLRARIVVQGFSLILIRYIKKDEYTEGKNLL